ncbi:MAG: hypothetical protein KAR45_10835 [Desulfobacteraceae bacterium]|nr:hypothetical protein [Desulfobacteraceae bacterium]
MPTLRERETETEEEFKRRIEQRTLEMGITYSFSEYIESMEKYLLTLETRVDELENKLNEKA